jgi:hypothetical protein
MALLGASIYLTEEFGDLPVCLIFFPPVGAAFVAGILFAQFTRLFKLRALIKH